MTTMTVEQEREQWTALLAGERPKRYPDRLVRAVNRHDSDALRSIVATLSVLPTLDDAGRDLLRLSCLVLLGRTAPQA